MSRILSSIGIGGATVDTVLPETQLSPGTTVEATVELEGGSSDQEIDEIYLALVTRGGGGETVLDTFKITDSITLSTGDTRTVTTPVTLPLWTPLTRGGQQVFLETGLTIDWAVDPSDEDAIEVVPGPRVEAVFEAVDDLGFVFDHTEIEESPWLDRQPFVQEFEYVPEADPFRETLDSLTVACVPREDDLRVFVEIDEREEAEEYTDIDYDEQEVALTFETTHTDIMRRQLKSTIDQYTHV